MRWLGRFEDPRPVRSRGSFHVVSVQREATGGRTIVIVGGPRADREGVARALESVERAHRAIRHAAVPKSLDLGDAEGVPYLELDCDAVADGDTVLRLLADAKQKLEYGQGDALFARFREALQAGHAVTDSCTGRPCCIGYISQSNILFSPSGKPWFVGFGHNFPVVKEDGRLEGLGAVWHAPELLAGEPATPVGDYVAVLMAVRALKSFGNLNEIVQILFGLPSSRAAAEAFEIARWFETEFLSQRPSARPSIEEGIARSLRVRELLGTRLDIEGLERRVAEILEDADGDLPERDGSTDDVAVAADGSWIELAGKRRTLGRAHRNLVRALLATHERSDLRASVWDLLEAGWPGEEPHPDVGANRVYVAIRRLRAMGLGRSIEWSAAGYRLSHDAPLRVVGSFGARR